MQPALSNSDYTAADIEQKLLDSFDVADAFDAPYPHWICSGLLPEEVIDDVLALPFEPALIDRYGGARNLEDDKRVYFNAKNRKKFSVCDKVATAFDSEKIRNAMSKLHGADLTDTHLRVEYCQDIDGFWLEPHTDISVKKYTMLLYVSRDPALNDAGTDVYSGPPQQAEVKHFKSVPYKSNSAMVFVPSDNTWHGVEPRTISGVRQSLIINYVTDDWRERWELA